MNAVIDENAIVKLYTEKHMAMKRIAKELNIAVGTVYNYLKRNRVKSRCIKDYEVTEKQKEAARKNGLAHKGKILSEETKRKISEAKKIHCAGACSRSFYVGKEVEKEDIKAEFKHGVLTLFVPKKEAKPAVEQKKTIAIEG